MIQEPLDQRVAEESLEAMVRRYLLEPALSLLGGHEPLLDRHEPHRRRVTAALAHPNS